ncbi:MAG TPA: leucine-rich repeat protein, partial [Candidatus Paceibacterota bacterium]|nr:leucine-rich repeat protein [Candidatus Paceibacterota bacterium]
MNIEQPITTSDTADKPGIIGRRAGRHLAGLILLAALTTLPDAVQAQFICTTNRNRITITRYTGPGGAVTIPETMNGLPVVGIADKAFEGSIDLTSVAIPASVTTIGAWVFKGCTSLTAIEVHASNTAFRSIEGVLFNKMQTKLLAWPGGRDGAYTVPASVTSIEIGAFYGCARLTNLTIPRNVTAIRAGAFGGCTGLTSVALSERLTKIEAGLFEGCVNLPSVTIPTTVTLVGSGAFRACTGLTGITIPNAVTKIEDGAFEDCANLAGVTFGTKLASIGSSAFARCAGLTAITIPNT